MSYQASFMIGGGLSALASALHLAIIVGGPPWYRFFGAGERLAQAAEQGRIYPALVTVAIAAVLAGWSAYAFSAAGLLPRLPFLKAALVAICGIYLVRGLLLAVFAVRPALATPFLVWSSVVVLVYAAAYAGGLITGWRELA